MSARNDASRSTRYSSHKRAAFTLAEILITLGIIGVVAAMTMPTLITSHDKKVTATRVKKAYSELSQAIRLSEVDNSQFQYWFDGSDLGFSKIENNKVFLEKYIVPYFSGLNFCSIGNTDNSCGAPVSASGINYTLNNGTSLSMLPDTPSKRMYIIVDTNGPKKPNILGRDVFYFYLNSSGKLLPSDWNEDVTREQILEGYVIGGVTYYCKPVGNVDDGENYYRHGCTALIFIDGWEFKDDYPW